MLDQGRIGLSSYVTDNYQKNPITALNLNPISVSTMRQQIENLHDNEKQKYTTGTLTGGVYSSEDDLFNIALDAMKKTTHIDCSKKHLFPSIQLME